MALTIADIAGVITLQDKFSPVASKVIGSLGAFGPAAAVVGGAAAAVASLGAAVVMLGNRGASVGDVARNFDNLSEAVGDTSSKMLGALRQATVGAINDFDLMKMANKALGAGFKGTSDDMGLMAAGARELAKRTGGDTAEAFDKLSLAVATGRTTSLASLGVFIDSKMAIDNYAASLGKSAGELNKQEKMMAAQKATMEALRGVVDAAGNQQADFGEQLAASAVKMENFIDKIAVAVNDSPALGVVMQTLNDIIQEMIGWLEANTSSIEQWIQGGIFFAIEILRTFVGIVGFVGDAIDAVIIVFYEAKGAAAAFALGIVESINSLAKLAASVPGVSVLDDMFGGDIQGTIKETDAAIKVLSSSFDDSMAKVEEQGRVNSEWQDSLKTVDDAIAGVGERITATSGKTAEAAKTFKKTAQVTEELSAEVLKLVSALTGADKQKGIEDLAQAVEAGGSKINLDGWRQVVQQVDAARNAGLKIPPTLDAQAKSWGTIISIIDEAAARADDYTGSLVDADGVLRDMGGASTTTTFQQQGKFFREITTTIDEMGQKTETIGPLMQRVGEEGAEGWRIIGDEGKKTTSVMEDFAMIAGNATTILRMMGLEGNKAASGIATGFQALATGDIMGAFSAGQDLSQMGGPLGTYFSIFSGGGALGTLGNILGGGDKKNTAGMREEFIEAAGGLDELADRAAAAGVSLDALFDAQKPADFQRAVGELTAAMDIQEQAQARLNEAVDRYGFTVNELGPAMQRQALHEQAETLLTDYSLLIASGIDQKTVLERMGPAMNEYVQTVTAAGGQIPAELRPALESMVQMGTLTDEAGNKISSLDNITFAETMSQGFDRVVEGIDRMISAMNDIPNVERTVTVRKVSVGGDGELAIPGLAAGGLVQQATLAVVGEAGPEVVMPLDRFESMMGGGGGAGGGSSNTLSVNIEPGAIVVRDVGDPQRTAQLVAEALRNNVAGQLVTVMRERNGVTR